jgi:hypothetical protein
VIIPPQVTIGSVSAATCIVTAFFFKYRLDLRWIEKRFGCTGVVGFLKIESSDESEHSKAAALPLLST